MYSKISPKVIIEFGFEISISKLASNAEINLKNLIELLFLRVLSSIFKSSEISSVFISQNSEKNVSNSSRLILPPA
jgi:hypothetical protein